MDQGWTGNPEVKVGYAPTVVMDVVVPNDSNIGRVGECLREQLERMWGVKTSVIPLIIGALGR